MIDSFGPRVHQCAHRRSLRNNSLQAAQYLLLDRLHLQHGIWTMYLKSWILTRGLRRTGSGPTGAPIVLGRPLPVNKKELDELCIGLQKADPRPTPLVGRFCGGIGHHQDRYCTIRCGPSIPGGAGLGSGKAGGEPSMILLPTTGRRSSIPTGSTTRSADSAAASVRGIVRSGSRTVTRIHGSG